MKLDHAIASSRKWWDRHSYMEQRIKEKVCLSHITALSTYSLYDFGHVT